MNSEIHDLLLLTDKRPEKKLIGEVNTMKFQGFYVLSLLFGLFIFSQSSSVNAQVVPAVVKVSKVTASGVKKGSKATASGVKKGSKATASGVKKGSVAAYKGGRWVVVKTWDGTKWVSKKVWRVAKKTGTGTKTIFVGNKKKVRRP